MLLALYCAFQTNDNPLHPKKYQFKSLVRRLFREEVNDRMKVVTDVRWNAMSSGKPGSSVTALPGIGQQSRRKAVRKFRKVPAE